MIAVAALLLIYAFFLALELSRYHQLPALKKDLRIRQEIVARFPMNYDVTIKTADLLGLGDRFYVAGGNSSFVAHAFSIDEDFEKDFESYKGHVNRPIVKLFYIREPGFLTALFTVVPFFDVERQFAELSLKQYYELSPIPVDESDKTIPAIKARFEREYGFPSTFSLLDFSVFDPDSDGQDEIVTHWLSYAGGSGGQKWSAIIDFVGGELKVSTGYPDFFNLEFSRALWAIVRYAGLLGNRLRNESELYEILPELKDMGLTDKDQSTLLSGKLSDTQANEIIARLHATNQGMPTRFLNLAGGNFLELYGRHTDDYSQFVKVGTNYYLAEAFYISDSECHWCGHYWRYVSFIYKDGRWISDRAVNGDEFEGGWVSETKKYTLNDIFGTYPDQGLPGLAFSFLSPDWTHSSKEHVSDPLGIETRLTSPVDKRIRKIHETEASEQ